VKLAPPWTEREALPRIESAAELIKRLAVPPVTVREVDA
jgi:hypothetical protein